MRITCKQCEHFDAFEAMSEDGIETFEFCDEHEAYFGEIDAPFECGKFIPTDFQSCYTC